MWRRRKYWSRRKFCRDTYIHISKQIEMITNEFFNKLWGEM